MAQTRWTLSKLQSIRVSLVQPPCSHGVIAVTVSSGSRRRGMAGGEYAEGTPAEAVLSLEQQGERHEARGQNRPGHRRLARHRPRHGAGLRRRGCGHRLLPSRRRGQGRRDRRRDPRARPARPAPLGRRRRHRRRTGLCRRGGARSRADRHPVQQCRHQHPQAVRGLHRGGVRPDRRRAPQGHVLHGPGGLPGDGGARTRLHHQRGLAAWTEGRGEFGALLRRQGGDHGLHARAGVGSDAEGNPRQCHRAGPRRHRPDRDHDSPRIARPSSMRCRSAASAGRKKSPRPRCCWPVRTAASMSARPCHPTAAM